VLTIPLRDEQKRLLGVITRRLDDQKPKYRYPKGFKIGQHLFASWLIRQHHTKVAIVEGSVDSMACWDARIAALGLLGSRLTDDQRDLLKRLGVQHVVLMLDNDKAGREGTYQVYEALKGTGIRVSVGVYRPYWQEKDPAALTPARRRKQFHSAKPWHLWQHDVTYQGHSG
jgi:DNA primase